MEKEIASVANTRRLSVITVMSFIVCIPNIVCFFPDFSCICSDFGKALFTGYFFFRLLIIGATIQVVERVFGRFYTRWNRIRLGVTLAAVTMSGYLVMNVISDRLCPFIPTDARVTILPLQFIMSAVIGILCGLSWHLHSGVTVTSRDNDLLTLKAAEHGNIIPVALDDICYIYTCGGHVFICRTDGSEVGCSDSLLRIMDRLPSDQFIRANKQFIISRRCIKEVISNYDSRLLVKMTCESPEPVFVSKNKSARFKEWFNS